MIQINKEQVKNQTILDIKLEENELSEDDLDAVSGGGSSDDYGIENEREDYIISSLSVVSTDQSVVTFDPLTGASTRTYPNGKTVS